MLGWLITANRGWRIRSSAYIAHLVTIAGFAGNTASLFSYKVELEDSILLFDFRGQIVDVFLQEINFLTLFGIVTLHADHLFQQGASFPIRWHVDWGLSGRRRVLRGRMILSGKSKWKVIKCFARQSVKCLSKCFLQRRQCWLMCQNWSCSPSWRLHCCYPRWLSPRWLRIDPTAFWSLSVLVLTPMNAKTF